MRLFFAALLTLCIACVIYLLTAPPSHEEFIRQQQVEFIEGGDIRRAEYVDSLEKRIDSLENVLHGIK